MPALPKKPKSGSFKNRLENHGLAFAKPQGNSRHDPSFRRTGKYKEGRRSLSYVKRRSEAGIVQAMPARKYKDNPMRWRKKPKLSSPVGTSKPWQKREGAKPSRPKGRSSAVSHKR